MKKNKIIFIISTVLAAFTFSSCFNAVFYNIRQDVLPEDSTVKGVINSICRYTISGEEYLFLAANDGLRYKLAKTGNERTSNKSSWKVYSDLPFTLHKYDYNTSSSDHTGQSIIKVLADKDTLYLVTTDYSQDFYRGTSQPDHTYIYATQLTGSDGALSGTWTEIKFADSIDDQKNNFFPYTYYDSSQTPLYFSHFNVFSTNSVNPEYRRVFVRGNNKGGAIGGDCYFELKGLNAPTAIYLKKSESLGDGIAQISTTEPEETVYSVDSVAYLGACDDKNLYFFDSIAVTTNETSSTESSIIYFAQSETTNKIIEEDYHASTQTLKYLYSDGGTAKLGDTETNCGEPIASLAVTKDYILIGRGDYSINTTTSGGIVKAALDSKGIPATSLSSFETNASIQLSYSYQVLTLLVTNPAKNERENTIYASITFKGTSSTSGTSFDNIGLWAYYSNRDNWNCE